MKNKLLFLISLIVIVFNINLISLQADTLVFDESKEVRVLFPAIQGMNGFCELDKNGNPYGYYSELFRLLEEYSALNFKFVVIENEDDLTKALESLIQGENEQNIDVLFNINKETYLQYYPDVLDFSFYNDCEKPIILYTQADNKDISSFDFSTIDGKTVGLCKKDATRNKKFFEYAEENGLYSDNSNNNLIKIKYYEDYQARNEDFQTKKCDIIVDYTDLLEGDVRALNEIGITYSYIGVKKGNSDILNSINMAFNQIKLQHPSILSTIYRRYFPYIYKDLILNKSEADYLKDKKTIKVAHYDDFYPLLFHDKNNQLKGLQYDYLIEIGKQLNVEIEFSKFSNYDAASKYLIDEKIDLLISNNSLNLVDSKLRNTMEYYSYKSVLVRNSNNLSAHGKMKVGVLESTFNFQTINHDIEYVVYNDPLKMMQDANNKVIDGCRSSFDFYNYCNYTLNMRNIFLSHDTYENSLSFVAQKSNVILHSIMNKNIQFMSGERLNAIKSIYLDKIEFNYTVGDFFAKHIILTAVIIIMIILILATIIVLLIINTLKNKRYNKQIYYYANYDYLTDLKNKSNLDKALNDLTSKSDQFWLIMLDIDNFKKYNDTYGHLIGDSILKSVAKELSKLKSDQVEFYRYAGDEFVGIIQNMSIENLEAIINRIDFNFYTTINEAYTTIKVTSSMGVATYPSDAKTAQDLISAADSAMYHIKEFSKNGYCLYQASKDFKFKQILNIDEEINKALDENRVYMVFQPQIDFKSNTIIGYEALMRFQDCKYGPSEFISVAEKNGQIHELGRISLEKSIRFMARFASLNLPIPYVSVNFSSNQFRDKKLVDFITKTMDKYKIPYKYLIIEMTETSLFTTDEEMMSIFNSLYDLGIQFDLDDFGDGYSSINNLSKFKFRTIKFDRFLIADTDNYATIPNLIQFVHGYNYTVLAEGVETEEQINFMRENGCDFAQGFVVAKPQTQEEIFKEIEKKD